MFVGRDAELDTLNRFYQKNSFEFAVIYGRRRVGKTSLIQEFIKEKRSIFFMSQEISEKENLENFSQAIQDGIDESSEEAPVYSSFQSAFHAIADFSKQERIVLVIDEFPYLSNSVQGIRSTLQSIIDLNFKHTNLFLILSGSSMSFMENQVLAYKSPLYGRKTTQLKIKPFTYFECKEYFPSISNEKLACIYAITGGIPYYLSFFDEKKSLEEMIQTTFLSDHSPLREEPINLLKQELREPKRYHSILQAIASGKNKLSEIATSTGVETATLPKYLDSLMELGIVERKRPVGQKNSKKTIYKISDGMFRFWFRFIPKNLSLIERGLTEIAMKRIEPHFAKFMGEAWEEICIQWLWEQVKKGRIEDVFFEMGSWWGNNPIEKREEEIDIVGIADETLYFGECKWREKLTDSSILEKLVSRSNLPHFSSLNKEFYLFSKSGFTSSLQEKKQDHLHLIELKNLFE